MESVHVKGKTYEIMGENLKCMNKNDLSKNYISKRLLYGWTLNEACKAPKHIRLTDYREEQKIKQMESQVRRIRAKVKEEKHIGEHPWLYDSTPQVHARSKYVADLMENDIFPKVVK
ncbi:MAG: SA1788 family PVL leukocidin-associated protein [Staphylococcus pseudoxylosus]|uniref:SA1788 family PVL leukocidin-associated protein n=1 Tax=Staphylococcus pseudoxylosus TaxID=2282419 RepID=UPI0031F6E74B